jgi:hypothetical protein
MPFTFIKNLTKRSYRLRKVKFHKIRSGTDLAKTTFGCGLLLNVPKRENFDLSFLTLIDPIWVVDLGTDHCFFYPFALQFKDFSAIFIQNDTCQPPYLK